MLERLIVFVEEYSMEVALEQLLPKLLDETEFEIRRFQCKDELLARLPERLTGYAAWLPETWAILVLVDRDDDDCLALKQRLENIAANTSLVTKAVAGGGKRFQVVNRLAIEGLEAWFFGDWDAVRAGYFTTGLRKLECARAVAKHMEPKRNSSRSFQAFCGALAAVLA